MHLSYPGNLDDLNLGYDTPVAQPKTFKLKSLHTNDVNISADETCCISAGDLALSHTDDPGGDTDDPGGGSTNDWSSF